MELSAESDNPVQADGEREEEEDTARHSEKKEEPVKEQDLEAQVSIQPRFTTASLFPCRELHIRVKQSFSILILEFKVPTTDHLLNNFQSVPSGLSL